MDYLPSLVKPIKKTFHCLHKNIIVTQIRFFQTRNITSIFSIKINKLRGLNCQANNYGPFPIIIMKTRSSLT